MTEAATRVENTSRPEVNIYRPGIRGFLGRVKNFVGITERVEKAVEDKVPEQVGEILETGFFERVGLTIDRGVSKIKETATKTWGFLKEKLSNSKEYFKEKAKEIQGRREQLGIVDTVRSYVQDGVDAIRSRVDVVEARWKGAEVKQLVGERIKLRESYGEAKKMKAEGKEVPEGYMVSRNQLREALRPIRVAELIARRERRELRQEAKELRRKIETKQNAKELLAEAKNKAVFEAVATP